MVVRQAISEGFRETCACVLLMRSPGIMAVDAHRAPAGCFEAAQLIDRIGERDRPVNGHPVVVEQHNELVELEVSGERNRLLADAFHEVAVGGEHVGMVVHEPWAEDCCQVAFGNRHADGVAKSLAERAGRRSTPGVCELSGWPGVSEPI